MADKERYAWVPARVLLNSMISRDARWLYSIFASHANEDGRLFRSLKKIADSEGVSVRSIERWCLELLKAGYVVTLPNPGRCNEYIIIRDREEVADVRERNEEFIADTRAKLSAAGRKGALVKGLMRIGMARPVALPPTAVSPPGDSPVAGTPDSRVASPPTDLSPITNQGEQTRENRPQQLIPLPSDEGSEPTQRCVDNLEPSDQPLLFSEPTASNPPTPLTRKPSTTIENTASISLRRRATR